MAGSYPTPNLAHFSSDDFHFIYEPAEDTFLFLDALEQESDYLEKLRPLVCLEIGSGSGCVSTFVSSILKSDTFYLCTDINNKAAFATKTTATLNGTDVNPIITDLVGGLLPRLEHSIDLILFNPPYVVTDSTEVASRDMIARSWAGGEKGREVMDRIFPLIPQLLSAEGVFYLVVIQENKPDEIKSLMSSLGLEMEAVLMRKAGIERLMILKFRKSHS